jgi:septum formation protein
MSDKIVLASESEVRKNILEKNGFKCAVKPANINEEAIKQSLLKEGATPGLISKNLAELKANKISQSLNGEIVIGADSIIDLEGHIISKPSSRREAMQILKKLNGKIHNLISSVCISRNGMMIWNYSDKAELTMKQMSDNELKLYLSKITDKALYSYNVYQIEGEGKNLFSKINGDKDTIMGLPIKKIKEYLDNSK